MKWLKQLAGKTWRNLPASVRRALVRGTQNNFTVSATAIILNDEGKLLLLDHVLRPQFGWGTPGGFVDSGEQPDEAIRREIREEAGLELHDLELCWIRTIKDHVEIIYRARANGEARIESAEIHRGAWFAIDELPEEMSDVQKFVINKTLS